jgi:subfamily B ATP-binding cassette protein MsbA
MKVKNGALTYRRLLGSARQYWRIFALGLLGTMVLSCTDAAFSWLVKPLINEGFINRNEVFIKWLPLIILSIFITRGVAGFISNYFISRVARNVVRDFRRKIFLKLLVLPSTYYDRNSSGYILSTVIYNVEQVANASSEALLTLLRESSLFIGLVTVMLVVSWRLTLMFVVVSPVIAWVIKWSSTRMRQLSGNVQQSVGRVTHVADEGIQGYKVIRLFGGQDYEYQKFHEATHANRQRELKVVVTNSVGTALVQFIIAIPIAMTMLLAMMPSMHVTAGAFGSVMTAIVMLLRPVRRLPSINSEIQKGISGAESVFKFLDEPDEVNNGTYKVNRVKGDIEFNQVNFTYQNANHAALNNISFTVKAGDTVAIVGRSGGGKSTLASLLPRFYDVQNGSINIDGVDIRDFELNNLRAQFALVSQDTVLFNDTIANNIAYGFSDSISQEQIIHAAKMAHAWDFIQDLPGGLNSMVGEDGVLLSGGQRQRIAIARALLKNAPILILDEATSALDSHSEKQIQLALENVLHKQTTIVIAHRLSTIEKADWIVVVENAEIVEQGTHAELISKNGAYALLHRMQFKEEPVHA